MPNEIDVAGWRRMSVLGRTWTHGEAEKLIDALPALLDELERKDEALKKALLEVEILQQERDGQKRAADYWFEKYKTASAGCHNAEAERDALKAKLEKVRKWADGWHDTKSSVNAILDAKEPGLAEREG